MAILLYQNLDIFMDYYQAFVLKVKYKASYHFGVFYNIDQAVFKPYIWFTTMNNSYATQASINTLYSVNSSLSASLSSSTLSSTNGADLVFQNSKHSVSLSQIVNVINELQLARQEICELQVKYGTRIHELEQQLKEKTL